MTFPNAGSGERGRQPWTCEAAAGSVIPTDWEVIRVANKDKNTKKSMEKKPAQKTLKEKRQAKKAK